MAAVVTAAIVGFCVAFEKLLGPVHAYVAVGIVLQVRERVCPEQTGLLLPVTGLVGGGGFTVTLVVAVLLMHPNAEVVVTEYVPAFTDEALLITGFCVAEEKLFGPFQLYVAPVELAVSEISLPIHTGELLPATGAAGVGFMVIEIVSVAIGGQPATEPVRE